MEVNREGIDRLLEKVTMTAKSAIKKSGEAVSATKLRVSINSDKTKIREIKEKLGELMYNAYNGEEADGGEVEELCRKIDELKEEIEGKEGEIAELKNRKRCPECGVNNEKDASFCKKCAAELADVDIEDEE